MSKGVLICTYFSYRDGLTQAYTLPYVRIIRNFIPSQFPVYLLTIEKEKLRLSEKELSKVRQELTAYGIYLVSLPYVSPGFSMIRWLPGLFRLILVSYSKRIDTLHGWCTPGGSIALFLSIITRKRLVLDSFEPHAEVMLETGTWPRNSIRFRILFSLEKIMARKSAAQICCTSSMLDYAREKYGCRLSRPMVKPACVSFELFNRFQKNKLISQQSLAFENKFVCIYAGKFGGLYLDDEFFDLIDTARSVIGDRFHLLLLSEESSDRIALQFKVRQIPLCVLTHLHVSHVDVPKWASLADFAVAPYKPVKSRRHAAPIKVSEYWALGLPTVITKGIADDSELVESKRLGSVILELNRVSYVSAINAVLELINIEGKENLAQRIISVAREIRSFAIAERVYRDLYAK